jgi:hypothetical protein
MVVARDPRVSQRILTRPLYPRSARTNSKQSMTLKTLNIAQDQRFAKFGRQLFEPLMATPLRRHRRSWI